MDNILKAEGVFSSWIVMSRRRKYKAKRDIPIAIRDTKSFSPTDIRNWVLKYFNTSVTPESVSNWMRRHKQEIDDLKTEIVKEHIDEEEMSMKVFESGTFEKFPMIVKFDMVMMRAKIQNRTGNISTLKRICQGTKPKINPLTQKSYKKGERKRDGTNGIDLKEHGWVLLHPERLDIEAMQRFIDLMMIHFPKVDTSGERMAFRGYMSANGVHVGSQISGQKHASAGKYARLNCPREVIQEIFDHLKKTNYEAYVVDRFMFKTGTRINATLAARLENVRVVDEIYDIRIYDKGRRSKYPDGKPWDKFISPDLLEDIKLLTNYPDRKTGKIFTLSDSDMSKINSQMLERYYPEMKEAYPDYDDSNHFWRHMFAQHMLVATGWNYGIVAALGGWDVKSLEESYGKPPAAIVKEWGKKLVINL